jgi:ABC-type transport system involved in multi-copper enzyme maturation permease subunit
MTIRQILTLATYVAVEAFRTRFFAVIVMLLVIGLGLTLFLGQVAIIETVAIQSSWLAAFLRLSAMYVVSLFVITSIVREFHDHSIYLWLSFPMRRSTYFFGKLSGFALVACLTAVLYGVALFWYVPGWQVGLWTLSLLCELLIVISLSFLCVFTFHQTVQAFSIVLGFYILARSISMMQLMTQGPLLQNSHAWTDHLINSLVELLAMLLPHLDRFTQTEWLVYHTGNLNSLLVIFVQTVIYVVLLATMSLFDLYRKNL